MKLAVIPAQGYLWSSRGSNHQPRDQQMTYSDGKKPTFTVILPQSPTVHTRVQPGGLWGLLCRNWMRNDYCDKFSTSGLQNHYVPAPPLSITTRILARTPKIVLWIRRIQRNFLHWAVGTGAAPEDQRGCDCSPQIMSSQMTDWTGLNQHIIILLLYSSLVLL